VVGNLAFTAPSIAPGSEEEEATQQGVGPTGGSTGGSPLGLLLLFVLGVAGIELVVYAIRRELRLHRAHPLAAVETLAVGLRGNTLRVMKRYRPKP
jgi:hypothetical protein